MTVQDEDRVVCRGDNVVIRCSLTETSFLKWVVGSVVIFAQTKLVMAVLMEFMSSSQIFRFTQQMDY